MSLLPILMFVWVTAWSGACSDLSVSSADKQKAPEVESIDRVEGRAGVPILLKGKNLDMDLTASVGGTKLDITFLDASEVSVTLPSDIALNADGTFSLSIFWKSKLVASFPMVHSDHLQTMSISELEADKVCSWLIFRNKNGEAVRGAAGCPKKWPPCQYEGQTDCLANADLQAFSRTELTKKVMKGKMVGGIAGEAESCQIK